MGWQSKKLRELINKPGCIDSLSVWDTFSAKLAEKEGFKCLTILGSLVSWSLLGKTDYGYITQTEMLDTARRIVQTVNVPVLVDVDDAFGDAMITRRTVQLFEQVGVAGLLIEDLKRPLRCSALGGGSLDPVGKMIKKIKAAIEAKEDSNFVIIARTDNYEGLDEVISRVKAYAQVGADMIFVQGLSSIEEMEKIGDASPIPLFALQLTGTQVPVVSPKKLESLGAKIHVYYPLFGYAARAQSDFIKQLKQSLEDRSEIPTMLEGFGPMEIEDIMGLKSDTELQKKYT